MVGPVLAVVPGGIVRLVLGLALVLLGAGLGLAGRKLLRDSRAVGGPATAIDALPEESRMVVVSGRVDVEDEPVESPFETDTVCFEYELGVDGGETVFETADIGTFLLADDTGTVSVRPGEVVYSMDERTATYAGIEDLPERQRSFVESTLSGASLSERAGDRPLRVRSRAITVGDEVWIWGTLQPDRSIEDYRTIGGGDLVRISDSGDPGDLAASFRRRGGAVAVLGGAAALAGLWLVVTFLV